MQNQKWNVGLGLLFAAASIVTLVWWIPNDVESGVLVQDRYSVEVGDALAPTAVVVGILFVSLAEAVSAMFFRKTEGLGVHEPGLGLTSANLTSLAIMAAVLIVSLGLMVWLGPLTVSALQSMGVDIKPYRQLTDTVPHKYIGFAAGGFVLVLSLIWWIEGHIKKRTVFTAIGAVIFLIVAYDVPFDSLLLPPNGGQ